MKKAAIIKAEKRERRHRRIRAKIGGTPERPRFSVFKSNRQIFAQLIDDSKGMTLVSASTMEVSKGDKVEGLGKLVAERALAKKIKKVVFDRGGYLYTGSIKALADSARTAGLEF